MVKASIRLLKSAYTPPISHTPQLSPLTYSLGLSYAAKSSPPFLHPSEKPSKYGFQGQKNKVGKWVDGMLNLRAGRGELKGGLEGGWDPSVAEQTKLWGAGEDFFAIVEGGGSTHLAVSDGVGGWSPEFDPSLFSQSLMCNYANIASSSPSSTPWDCLSKAYQGVLEDEGVEAGSATATGVILGDGGRCKGVNLGDSGFSVLRDDEIAFATTPQTHFFNCPRQLSKIPRPRSGNPNIGRNYEGTVSDKPDDGDKFDFEVQPGDVIVLYTDGLSDNLPSSHLPRLAQTLTRLLKSEQNNHLSIAERSAEKARLLADVLVGYGRMAMTRTGDEDGGKGWKTPFELEAAKMAKTRGGYRFKGGKIDDITVITAVVSERL